MNQREEVREQFRSAAKGRTGAPVDGAVEEAKRRFRESAADLDRKIGLENITQLSLRGGIPFFLMLFSMIKAQHWLVPIFSGFLHFGGKTVESVISMLTPHRRKNAVRTAGKSQKKNRS